MKNYKLLRDNVLVQILDQEEEINGIYIPERLRKNSDRAKVIAVGPGLVTKDATVEIEVKPGDLVLIEKHGVSRIAKIEGEEFDNLYIVRHPDIFAVLEEEN